MPGVYLFFVIVERVVLIHFRRRVCMRANNIQKYSASNFQWTSNGQRPSIHRLGPRLETHTGCSNIHHCTLTFFLSDASANTITDMYIYICVCVKVQRFWDVDSLFHVLYDEVKRSHAHTHICIVYYMFIYNKEAHTLHVIHNKHIYIHTYIHILII